MADVVRGIVRCSQPVCGISVVGHVRAANRTRLTGRQVLDYIKIRHA